MRPGQTDFNLTAADVLESQGRDESGGSNVETKPCSTCGSNATTIRYSSVKARGTFAVCDGCYSEGRFPSTMHAGEFVKVNLDPVYKAGKEQWADEEVLKLLEGLEMFADDWNKISDHVGTRTKDQCIVHFLQLPIEDPFLEATRADLGPLQYATQLPFSQLDNPIMSVMAFLASAVDPKVAARAAGRAIDEFERSTKDGAAGGETRSDVKGKGKESDAMEVDGEGGVKTEDEEHSPRNNIERAAAIALGAAAAKAHVLALEEDATLHSLVTSVVEAQVRKLEVKLQQFAQLESLLEVERRDVERTKTVLFEERLKMSRMMGEIQEMHARAKAGEMSSEAQLAVMMAQNGAAQVELVVDAPPPSEVNGGYQSML